MYRCPTRRAWTVALAALLPLASLPAAAQQARNFPPLTLRGSMSFGDFPSVSLNGRAATLSPGSRIRDELNRIVLPATVNGRNFLVHYTVGMNEAQVQDVWILLPDEAAIKPWPRTLDEARTWTWDPTARTWSKP